MIGNLKKWWHGEFNPPEIPPERLVRYAELVADISGESPKALMDQSLALAKWLLGSLLVLNGGAALATLNSANHITGPGRPALIFFTGIALAMLNGWLVQVSIFKSMPLVLDRLTYWTMVAHDGQRNFDVETSLARRTRQVSVASISIQISGWASFAAFAWGYLKLMTAYH